MFDTFRSWSQLIPCCLRNSISLALIIIHYIFPNRRPRLLTFYKWQSTLHSTMEPQKSRGNRLLVFALLINLILTITSVGTVIYKLKILENQVLQLQSRPSVVLQTETSNNGDDEERELTQRRKREYESFGEAKSCISCRSACMQLFGLGASARVCLLRYLKSYSQQCMVVFPT